MKFRLEVFEEMTKFHACFCGVLWFFLLFTIPTLVLLAADEKVAGRLLVEDVLAKPGTPAMLKARLVQDRLIGITGLGGETIEFVVQGQRVGTVLTGGDGRAFLEFKTHMRGNQKIIAKVEPSPRVNSVSGSGNFASWERRKPILLVDVVTLLKSQEGNGFSLPTLPLLNSTKFGEPDEDAPNELTKLGKGFESMTFGLETRGLHGVE